MVLNDKNLAQAIEKALALPPKEAPDHLLALWEKSDQGEALTLKIALLLSDMGAQSYAIELISRSITRCAVSPESLLIAGKIALEIKAADIAEKLLTRFITLKPDRSSGYLYLARAQFAQEKFDDVIALLQKILPHFSEEARLWLLLAQALDARDGQRGQHLFFYQEAHRLAKHDAGLITAIANRYDVSALAAPLFREALSYDPEEADAHFGLALWCLAHGDLEEGFKHYEYRFHKRRSFADKLTYDLPYPIWQGQNLKTKTLILMAEQGIGDEILFAASFPLLIEAGASLLIGCDPRLVSIMERSFKGARAFPYNDIVLDGQRTRHFPALKDYIRKNDIKPDYQTAFASVLQFLWTSPDTVTNRSKPYLEPDQILVNHWQPIITHQAAGRCAVGISWQSGHLKRGRSHDYPGLKAMLPLLKQPDCVFFVLQYDFDPESVKAFGSEHGVDLRIFEGVDLKGDIEANLAIMAALDVIIGPPMATQVFAMGSGRPTYVVGHGRPFYSFGDESGNFPPFPTGKSVSATMANWPRAMWKIRRMMRQKFKLPLGGFKGNLLQEPSEESPEKSLDYIIFKAIEETGKVEKAPENFFAKGFRLSHLPENLVIQAQNWPPLQNYYTARRNNHLQDQISLVTQTIQNRRISVSSSTVTGDISKDHIAKNSKPIIAIHWSGQSCQSPLTPPLWFIDLLWRIKENCNAILMCADFYISADVIESWPENVRRKCQGLLLYHQDLGLQRKAALSLIIGQQADLVLALSGSMSIAMASEGAPVWFLDDGLIADSIISGDDQLELPFPVNWSGISC